ncbi:hypothetical protein BRADI_4g18915v3 [Brachypodium distachyon]|uniref:Uncharacterized protein n=1 Tax=Brachypodium distachyon TaxID=15368 RepID=A0A2K2CNN5_BRADI|nr:hypothetical protein BRADI_4g18915v3 [Brachypodium distachyon]
MCAPNKSCTDNAIKLNAEPVSCLSSSLAPLPKWTRQQPPSPSMHPMQKSFALFSKKPSPATKRARRGEDGRHVRTRTRSLWKGR